MARFKFKSVSDLQKYLIDRRVVFTGKRKLELITLCEEAERLGLATDPPKIYFISHLNPVRYL